MEEFPPWAHSELKKLLVDVFHLWSQPCLQQEIEAETCFGWTGRPKVILSKPCGEVFIFLSIVSYCEYAAFQTTSYKSFPPLS